MRNKLVIILMSSTLLSTPAGAMSFGEFLDHMLTDAKTILNGEPTGQQPVEENGAKTELNGESENESRASMSNGSLQASTGGASASVSDGSIEASANGASASISGDSISASANGTSVSIGGGAENGDN